MRVRAQPLGAQQVSPPSPYPEVPRGFACCRARGMTNANARLLAADEPPEPRRPMPTPKTARRRGRDVYEAARRSEIMRRVRREGTSAELQIRAVLDSLSVAYLVNDRSLPGSPDLVVPALRKVLFVHGCFWHQHAGCPRAKLPGTRRRWWTEKLQKNRRRDARAVVALRAAGWSVAVVWQCQTRDVTLVSRIKRFLTRNSSQIRREQAT